MTQEKGDDEDSSALKIASTQSNEKQIKKKTKTTVLIFQATHW